MALKASTRSEEQVMAGKDELTLGGQLDPSTAERTGRPLELAPDALTTHGVIVGMTGSGKTGLGVVLLEEILTSGRPALILDPKGDLANLCLQFPDLAPSDFAPWVDPAEARREGISQSELAARTAERWASGLSSWGLGGDDIRALGSAVDIQVYTPGSTSGRPLNLVGSLSPPANTDEEGRREAAEGLVSGLLTLAGIDSDPLTSPEHILLSSLVDDAWTRGAGLTLESLIGGVQTPPFRKLGVFDVDTFFPQADRLRLAMRLNGLAASPSFAAWRVGDPLDPEALLHAPGGKPRASIIQLAHLSDQERMFVVTLLLSGLVSWMRGQPGTSDLRALLYIDELFGFAPPSREPPSKKPLLTLFKQARAHGLGVVVATQNPVDMDYKLMSNAGTWMVGRLQTERDKARILEALRSADGSVDVSSWDRRIGTLGKRQFLLKRSRSPEPELFTTRWAMSFLRGPITLAELDRLPSTSGGGGTAGELEGAISEGPPEASEPGHTPTPTPAAREDETSVQPRVASGVTVRFLDPAAPWARELEIAPESGRYQAGVAFDVHLYFDETSADLRHEEEWEAVLFPLGSTSGSHDFRAVDHDPRDFRESPTGDIRYVLPEAPVDEASFFKDLERDLLDHLVRAETLELQRNRDLKLVSRVGETPDEFSRRCMAAAEESADREAASLRDRYESKLRTQRDQVARAERRVRELDVDVSSRRQNELLTGAGDLLGMFLGGRRSTRGLNGVARRRSMTRRTEERLRSAEERLEDEMEDVRELEEELARDLERIWDRWREAAERIDSLTVGLERNDIRVRDTILFWAPVATDG
jgi:hypothetical protein